jgi:predicted DNA-binding transcriptional regulator AlpA
VNKFDHEMKQLFKEAFMELVKELHSERYMRLEEVTTMTSISPRSIARMVKEDEFPRPRKPSTGMSRWLHSELVAWMRTRPTNLDDLIAMQERA